MKILLVDDIPDTRELFRVMLEKLGHNVLEAANGMQAIQAAITFRPDCILMDLSMPEVDGLLATAALRRIVPFQCVPIVAITAHPEELSREKAVAAGCDGYLRKPFAPQDLAAVLDRFSQGRAS